jgi:8-oxo-dGTP diphosphatase
MLFLVRHAKAGDRLNNSKQDFVRALTRNGWHQAEALVDSLIAAGANGPLLASPFTRCLQTLEPLAARLGVGVTADDRLREGRPFRPVVELLAELPDGAVLSSHGDVIPDVMTALERRGCTIVGEPQWKKASVWLLHRNDDGEITTASAWPPPD